MGKLSDEFFMPPFSVLNAREGAWQKRKKEWISLGIKSELGRGEEGSKPMVPRS
jgi:alkylhydroperoxidase/carboxymuconolactone decarboxylase family protein YurZ